jgi:ELWxxDGT repeat protein
MAITISVIGALAQEQTAHLIRDVNRTPGEYDAGIEWITPVPKGAVFPRYTFENGSELWFTDGTPTGARLLKEFVPGQKGSSPSRPMAFGEGPGARVAFILGNSPGDELWITDGTEKGTVPIYKNETGAENPSAIAVGGTTRGVFFESSSPVMQYPGGLTDRRELFFNDGTAAGTYSLNSIRDDFEQFIYNPHFCLASGPWCYFVANSDQIWRSDGTAAGTQYVLTLPDASSGFTLAGERLFFISSSEEGDPELCVCPMEGGDLTRIGPPDGKVWYDIYQIRAAGDRVFLQVEEDVPQLWVSDGTAEGTRHVPFGFDLDSDWYWSSYEPMQTWKDAAYFQMRRDNIWELWRSDGTPAGTGILATFPEEDGWLTFFEGVSTSDFLYFHVVHENDHQVLWRTKGTPASTRPVRGAPPANIGSGGPYLAETPSGDIFLSAAQGTGDAGVWKLRGKNGGALRMTRPVKSTGTGVPLAAINGPFPRDAPPYEMLDGDLLALVHTGSGRELWRMKPDGSRAKALWKAPSLARYDSYLGFRGANSRGALFTLDDGYGLRQVWFTDGTTPGTRLLDTHTRDADNAELNDFVKVGERWIYSVANRLWPPATPALWITDGSPDGTSQVVAADGSAPRPDFASMVAYENGVAFIATGIDGKSELWRSDGTPAGTVRLKNEWQGQPGGRPVNLSVVGGKLHFSIHQSSNWVLWQSDGTAAGTLPSATLANYHYVNKALDLGGAAIFPGCQTWPWRHWWRHDATGVHDLQDAFIVDHIDDPYTYSREQVVAGSLLFYCGKVNSEEELWVTDGTAAGTRQVADLNPGPWPDNSSSPLEMLAVGNRIYFTANDGEHGFELWRSDGTPAGTVLVADIEPGPVDSRPLGLKVMDGKLYFTAYRHDVGRELFVVDLPAE